MPAPRSQPLFGNALVFETLFRSRATELPGHCHSQTEFGNEGEQSLGTRGGRLTAPENSSAAPSFPPSAPTRCETGRRGLVNRDVAIPSLRLPRFPRLLPE